MILLQRYCGLDAASNDEIRRGCHLIVNFLSIHSPWMHPANCDLMFFQGRRTEHNPMNEGRVCNLIRQIVSLFSNHAQEGYKLIFRQSRWELTFCGLLRFGSENGGFRVLEFKSELLRKCVANDAAVATVFPLFSEKRSSGSASSPCGTADKPPASRPRSRRQA